MGKWLFQLLIVLFTFITIAGLYDKQWGMMLYGLRALLLNVGVLLMLKG